jgi:hypothetical protein
MEQTVLVHIVPTNDPVVAVQMPHGWTLRHLGPCGGAHCDSNPCTFAEWHNGTVANGWHYLPGCTGRLAPYLHAIMLAAAAGQGDVK